MARALTEPRHADRLTLLLRGKPKRRLDPSPHFIPCSRARCHKIEVAGICDVEKLRRTAFASHGAGVIVRHVRRNEPIQNSADHQRACFRRCYRSRSDLGVGAPRAIRQRIGEPLDDAWSAHDRNELGEAFKIANARKADNLARCERICFPQWA